MLLAPEDPGQGKPMSNPLSSGRASSMTFRADGTTSTGSEAQQDQAMLDPANQSLADALNILLKLIYVGVFCLGIAYLLSGFKNIQEGQRGIRLLFGKVEQSDLEPGLRWAPPYPFGELLTVPQGQERVDVQRDFWMYLPNENAAVPLDKLPPSASLKPDQGGSGSIITGDSSLVHARWSVQYRRENATKYAQHMMKENEQALVLAAAKRGVVRACAELPVDVLLRQSPNQPNSVAARAREIAQETLDAAQSGITIEQLLMTEITPPLSVRADFSRVQAAAATQQKSLEEAQSERSTLLNASSGEVGDALLEMIAQYELAVAQSDQPAMRQQLATIDGVLQGAPVTMDGTDRKVSGQVTKLVSDAQAYRTQVVTLAQADLRRFQAMLDQFRANPLVMVNRQWSSAVQELYGRKTVRKLFFPITRPGDILQVMINKDPFLEREMEKEVKQQEAIRAANEQQQRQLERGFVTEAAGPALRSD
jgi:modulator of FtsH protease HflK